MVETLYLLNILKCLAQHIAAELVGKYLKEKDALPAVSLSTDTSILTAISNDYGYDQIFKS